MDEVTKEQDWLRRERRRLGWSTTEMADRARAFAIEAGDPIKLSQQSISDFENNEKKRIPSWLRYVRQAIDAADEDRETHGDALNALTKTQNAVADLGFTIVPEYELGYSMGGGSPIGYAEAIGMIPFQTSWLRSLIKGSFSDLIVARGEGDSMLPTLLDQDLVLIDTAQSSIDRQDRIWAVVYGDLGMIKRVRRLPEGKYHLMSDNPSIPPIEVVDDEMQVVGRVVWVGRAI